MTQPYIFYREKKRFFDLPRGWRLGVVARGPEDEQPPDPLVLAGRALDNPIGAPTLAESLKPSDQVAVLVEDLTRASPKNRVMTTLLTELVDAGAAPENIRVVIALGTHRGLTQQELTELFSYPLLTRYQFLNHDCHDPTLVDAGRLPDGQPVKLNRHAVEADFVIGVGSIFPHPMNGFGGGGKILFPGVADFDSIRAHHMKYTFSNGVGLGKLDGNPFYESIRDFTADKLDLVINSVLDSQDRAVDMVAGHPVEAHLAGIEKCKPHITREFDQKADLVITTSFPYKEGPQIFKALAAASQVAKPGAPIVLAAELIAPLPDAFAGALQDFRLDHPDDLAGAVADHFQNNKLILDAGVIDLNMALGMALRTLAQHPIMLASEDVSADYAQRMGFDHAENVEQALTFLHGDLPANPLVHVIPAGGVILPTGEGSLF